MSNNGNRMSGNKGEWSELYAFMKLLSQGRVYAANEKVEKIDEVYYPILRIMREETRGEVIDYVIDNEMVHLEIQSNRILSVPRTDLEENANLLLKEIASHSGSFEVEEIANFANGIKVTKIKAPAADTTDISMQIEDIHTNFIRNVGFSIKSEVGNAPTLLNAGLTTNFIYKVTGITSEQAEEINAIDTRTKIKDRMAKIAEYGGSMEYYGMNHDGFKRNLIMVDSSMPEIIGKSTHNRRERPVHGHRGGSRGRFYYRITTFEGRPWDARDPYKTTFMALKHEIRLSIWRKQKETPGVEKAPGVSSPQRKESGRSGRDDGELRFWVRPGHPYKAVTSISQAEALAHGLTHLHHLVFAAVLARELDWCAALQDAREDARPWGVVGIGLRSDVWVEVRRDDHRPAVLVT